MAPHSPLVEHDSWYHRLGLRDTDLAVRDRPLSWTNHFSNPENDNRI